MKNIGSRSTVVLLVLLLISLWYIHDQHNRYERLEQDYSNVIQELENTKAQLAAEQGRSEALEKKSIEGILKETNKAVISGWETLLNTVEKELEKARSVIRSEVPSKEVPSKKEKNHQPAPSEPQNAAPIEGERT